MSENTPTEIAHGKVRYEDWKVGCLCVWEYENRQIEKDG